MARAAAIILQNNSLALIERNRNGQIYYLFPGGQVEAGESQVETVTREVKEEIGLEISVGRLIAEVIFKWEEPVPLFGRYPGRGIWNGHGRRVFE